MLTFEELLLVCEKYPSKDRSDWTDEAHFEWLDWLYCSLLHGEFDGKVSNSNIRYLIIQRNRWAHAVAAMPADDLRRRSRGHAGGQE